MLSTWLMAVAHATIYDVTFCAEVDIALIGGASGPGDNWTDDTDDKPARGFKYELSYEVLGSHLLQDSGYLSDSGGTLGCTAEYQLDSTREYRFKLFSEASVDGNTLHAQDNDDPDTGRHYAIVTAIDNWSPTADITLTPTLPGSTDDRWNHLAMAAFALYFENAGLTGEDIRLYSEQGPCCYANTAKVYLLNENNNFTITHELGHVVGYLVDDGGASPAKNYQSNLDDCDGGGDSGGNDHGTVTKEYYSAAMVEGLGDWYSAVTWNDISTSATDCEYLRGHGIDFDIDGTNDYLADTEPYPCTGDPMSLIGWVDDDDWLEDAISEGAGGCTTPQENRSTQFDFVRYLFAMRTEEDLTMNQIWDLWDDSDPNSWDANGGSLCLDPLLDPCDDPEDRWEAVADLLGTAHDDQKDHGMDNY